MPSRHQHHRQQPHTFPQSRHWLDKFKKKALMLRTTASIAVSLLLAFHERINFASAYQFIWDVHGSFDFDWLKQHPLSAERMENRFYVTLS